MGRQTGGSTLVKLAQAVCRAIGKFGVAGVVARTGSVPLGVALQAVATACSAWEQANPNRGKVMLPMPQGPPEDPPVG